MKNYCHELGGHSAWTTVARWKACTLEGPYTRNSAFCLQVSLVNRDKVSKNSVSYIEGCT